MRLPPDARLRADVGSLLEAAGESSGAEVLEPILVHLRLLARWNDAYGLTRITEWPEVLDRHVRESLLPLRWVAREQSGRILDVGSGNGFPALPILACRPGLDGVLLERSERKGLFLDAVIRESGWASRVQIDPTDAETYGRGKGTGKGPSRRPTSAADIERASVVANRSAADNASVGQSKSGAQVPRFPAASTGSSPRRENPQPEHAVTNEGGFEYVVSRATLAPEKLLELASRWVCPGGRVFLFAGDLGRRYVADAADEGASTLTRIERLRIPGRRASYLHVFDTGSG